MPVLCVQLIFLRRFKELIPILRGYVELRKIPNEPILLVAHNARRFDVPFLINEFRRCSEEIPSDWLFVDTLPLARELEKLEGKILSISTCSCCYFHLAPLRQHPLLVMFLQLILLI